KVADHGAGGEPLQLAARNAAEGAVLAQTLDERRGHWLTIIAGHERAFSRDRTCPQTGYDSRKNQERSYAGSSQDVRAPRRDRRRGRGASSKRAARGAPDARAANAAASRAADAANPRSRHAGIRQRERTARRRGPTC